MSVATATVPAEAGSTLPPVGHLSPRQRLAWQLLGGEATHVLLYGGARSGKTYTIVRAVVQRALGAPGSTHAILRYRFNHLKASIIYDTLPLVLKNEFPGIPGLASGLNKSDWYFELGEGSRIYFGGLDDKERTEKILGQGHATIYLNEVSQISYSSVLKATTRLSQKIEIPGTGRFLRLKAFYDCNPPMQGHWTHKRHILGLEPATGQPLANKLSFAVMQMNPKDNPFLPQETLDILATLPPRERARFWEGEFGLAVDQALWSYDLIDSAKLPDDFILPDMARVVIAVDPSGCHGPEDKRSDEVGIIVVGKGMDGRAYILADESGKLGPGGDEGWGKKVSMLYRKWNADFVVAEINFGGSMVEAVLRAADSDIPFKAVTATRGKAVRADPVSALYHKGLVKHAEEFPELCEQLLQFSTAGYGGERSPDHADAMVWGVSELMIDRPDGLGLLEWYQQEAAKLGMREGIDQNMLAEMMKSVPMLAPKDWSGSFYGKSGHVYNVTPGAIVPVKPEDESTLARLGWSRINPELAKDLAG